MADGRTFRSLQDAMRFMQTEIDRPTATVVTDLGHGLVLHAWTHRFGDGGFTNIYDLSWADDIRPAIRFSPRPTPAIDIAPPALASATAGFFMLADEASGQPAQTSLNLAVAAGRVLSLPVVDREALIVADGRLSMQHVRAAGTVEINGVPVTWAGSRTAHTAQSYAFGNANIVITRRPDLAKGSVRVLDERSRFTPPSPAGSGCVDVGFQATADAFASVALAAEGGLDIFAHDVVLRCQHRHIDPHATNIMRVHSIGALHAAAWPDSAVSVGPSLDVADFTTHPIQRDTSLGDPPPFTNDRKARMVAFREHDGRTHLRLFDGRPGSTRFQGATPTEARDLIADYQWGCFLGGGQTAKLWVVRDRVLASFGNRQYLRWPQQGESEYVWVPDRGRPVSSVLTFAPAGQRQRLRGAFRTPLHAINPGLRAAPPESGPTLSPPRPRGR